MSSAGRLRLLRHGETDWSRGFRHTGRTDIPLNSAGVEAARALAPLVTSWLPALVVSSPLSRAWDTALLAGLDPEMDEDLIEWDYGVYEGRTTANIRAELGDPHWSVFNSTEGLGETVNEVGMRADAVLSRVVPTINAGRNVVLIAHSHLLRILAARWLDLPPDRGRSFALAPAASATLGFERDTPAVLQWNVTV